MITLNALTAADKVIIPVQAHFLPVKGLEQLLKTVNKVKRQLNPKLQIGGILMTMVESIKEYGVLVPIIVRPMENGNYEIISGHHRHHAAVLVMVDSNLQRENILPSEKAFLKHHRDF